MVCVSPGRVPSAQSSKCFSVVIPYPPLPGTALARRAGRNLAYAHIAAPGSAYARRGTPAFSRTSLSRSYTMVLNWWRAREKRMLASSKHSRDQLAARKPRLEQLEDRLL